MSNLAAVYTRKAQNHVIRAGRGDVRIFVSVALTGMIEASKTRTTGVDGSDPVFIMGLNRSGTTILYQLLHSTGKFNAVTVFHLVYRNRLRELQENAAERNACRSELFSWFEQRKLNDRGYDAITIGPDLPEEYGYALTSRGPTPRLSGSNFAEFLSFTEAIQMLGDPARPLLLKNPWDTNNFLAIKELIPRARFVFIHRNPVLVLSSQLKMFGSLIQAPSEYDMLIEEKYRRFCESSVLRTAVRILSSDSLPFLFQRLYNNVIKCCDYMLTCSDELGPAAMHVTYDQLCGETNKTLEAILSFLGWDERISQDFSVQVKQRTQPLHPKVKRHRNRIEARTRRYCHKFGVAV